MPDTLIVCSDPPDILSLQTRVNQKRWTICIGAFKEKNNARLMFRQLSEVHKPFAIVRDSFFFITLGEFTQKDSAYVFQKNKCPKGTYLMKVNPAEPLLNVFPD